MRTYTLISILTCLISSSVVAQKKDIEWEVGYFTPYLSNIGGTIGCAFDLKELGDKSTEQRVSKNQLQVLTQLGYFTQVNVSHNFLFNPELVYRWSKLEKRFFLTSSVGTGYLRSFQRQEGILNLGTGETDYRYEALNYFLPTLNIGFGLEPKKRVGFYFKMTYGRKLSTQNSNAGFLGISSGLILKFNNT